MRELDALLQSFVDRELPSLGDADVARFERILELPDPVLHAYLTGRSEPDDPEVRRLIERLKASHRPSA
jgi:antitoxin CptB